MNKKLLYLFVTLTLAGYAVATDEAWLTSRYLDTQFLARYDQVKEALINDGFKEIAIPTQDGWNLQGLYLERPTATATLLVCCGFYPGRKEGMASLYAMLPEEYNIMLLDARGHGTSEGPFWTNIHHYGKDEYLDVIAALEIIRSTSSTPIIVFGICAGAFHAARALIHLEEQHRMAAFNIKGLVFDSGLASIIASYDVPRKDFQQKVIPRILNRYVYPDDSKREVKERLLYIGIWTLASKIMKSIEWCVKPFLFYQEGETKLFDKIYKISCPIFYIHAKNDTYARIQHAQKLAAQSQHPTSWWLEESEHACNHLKFKLEYRAKLIEFLNHTISTRRSTLF